MQRVYDKVNFTLSYIGTYVFTITHPFQDFTDLSRPTENDGVACMHGAPECMGNILELCAAKNYPDPKIYLGFTMCLSKDYKNIPERSLVEDCALEHGIDFQVLNECASDNDGTGLELLRASVRRSTEVYDHPFPPPKSFTDTLSRSVLRRVAQSGSITRFTAFTMAPGKTVHMVQESVILLLRYRNFTALDRLEYLCPELTSFANSICQSNSIHSRIFIPGH